MKQTMMKRIHTTPAKRSRQSPAVKSNLSNHTKKENAHSDLPVNIQTMEEYRALAQEAMTSGDRILAESLFQHAEHYLRLHNETRETVSPKSKPASSRKKRIVAPNDFEMSIEQELATAQARL